MKRLKCKDCINFTPIYPLGKSYIYMKEAIQINLSAMVDAIASANGSVLIQKTIVPIRILSEKKRVSKMKNSLMSS